MTFPLTAAFTLCISNIKVDGSKNALQQIKGKNYQQKYQVEGKNIFLIGIDFSSVEENISRFEWEQPN